MPQQITLYGLGPTRSARCQWTLLELGLDFEFVEDGKLIGSDELRQFHPQAKMPAIVIDGVSLFESSAICTHLCDLVPNNSLLGAPGSIERAKHEQWTAFALSEMECYLWSNMKHDSFYPEEKRVPEVIPANNEEFQRGAKVIDDVLAHSPYLVGDQFSVTDIFVSWTINWGRRLGQLDGFENLMPYLERLFAREHCKLNKA